MFPRRSIFFTLVLAALPLVPVRGADLDRLLPERTEMVVSVNLRQILDSAIVKKYVLPDFESDLVSGLRKFINVLGLNPIKDIASFTAALPGDADSGQWVVLVYGSFDVAKLNAAVDRWFQSRPGNIAVHEVGQVRIYEDLTEKDQKSSPRFYTLLDKEVAVISPSKARVLEVLSRRTGKAETKANPGLAALVGKQDGQQTIWIASVASQNLKNSLGQQGGVGALAGKMQSLSGGVTLGDDIKLNLRVQMSDAKSARDMRGQLEAIKAIAILAISVNEDLKDYGPVLMDVLNAIAFTQDQGTLGADLTIVASVIERGAQAGKKP